jgi:hypothetical protein
MLLKINIYNTISHHGKKEEEKIVRRKADIPDHNIIWFMLVI